MEAWPSLADRRAAKGYSTVGGIGDGVSALTSLNTAMNISRLMCSQAFLAASLKTDVELLKWFRDRLIWNEPETVVDLLKNGLFVRLYEPQVSVYTCWLRRNDKV